MGARVWPASARPVNARLRHRRPAKHGPRRGCGANAARHRSRRDRSRSRNRVPLRGDSGTASTARVVRPISHRADRGIVGGRTGERPLTTCGQPVGGPPGSMAFRWQTHGHRVRAPGSCTSERFGKHSHRVTTTPCCPQRLPQRAKNKPFAASQVDNSRARRISFSLRHRCPRHVASAISAHPAVEGCAPPRRTARLRLRCHEEGGIEPLARRQAGGLEPPSFFIAHAEPSAHDVSG